MRREEEREGAPHSCLQKKEHRAKEKGVTSEVSDWSLETAAEHQTDTVSVARPVCHKETKEKGEKWIGRL